MCWRSVGFSVVLLLPAMAVGADGYMIGAGIEGETEDGLSTGLLAGVGFTQDTWLTGSLARSSVDLPTGRKLESTYADLELDHHFDPVGVQIGAAYWGDDDVLDSDDLRLSLYWRGESSRLSLDLERRDFDFTLPPTELTPGRTFSFDADGLGASARFDLTESLRLRLSGMSWDYSVPFRPIENRDVISLRTASRLSLLNSLLDNRASVSLSIEQGLKSWTFQLSTNKGIVDRARTRSATLQFLFPVSDQNDIELGVGYDDSDLYGDATYFSVFWYFYGD